MTQALQAASQAVRSSMAVAGLMHAARPVRLPGITMPLTARPRAILGASIRADASPQAAFEQLQRGFDEFKTANDAKLQGKADDGKVERIAADLAKMQAAIDAETAARAASQMGAGERKIDDPDYSSRFSAFFRDGAEEGAIKAAQRSSPVRAAMTEGSSANGGYVTPVEWDRTITGRLKLISPIRQNAKVQAISTVGFSKVYTDRVIGSGWVGETAPRPATVTPGMTSLAYSIGEMYAMPNASQDFLDDALVNIEEWLAGEVDTEFARQEGIAFLTGTGTNMPTGILTYVTGMANAAVHPFGAIATVNSGAAAAYTSDQIITMIYVLPMMYSANAKFFGNRTSLAALMKLKNGQGNYLWQPSFQAGTPSTLNAQPWVDVPDMPNVAANAIALLYGDMATTYLVIDRQGTRVLRDPYTNKPFVQFYTTKRVGGGLLNPDAMKAMVISA